MAVVATVLEGNLAFLHGVDHRIDAPEADTWFPELDSLHLRDLAPLLLRFQFQRQSTHREDAPSWSDKSEHDRRLSRLASKASLGWALVALLG